MNRIPRFFGTHAEPGTWLSLFLGSLPFVILLGAYILVAHTRHEKNAQDKLVPTIVQMTSRSYELAVNQDQRTGERLLIVDTIASLRRVGVGVTLSALCGLLFGMNMGILPGIRAMWYPFVRFLSIVPPVALLPILLVSFGTGEVAKVALIFICTVFVIIRDLYLETSSIPREHITKAFTLGANQLDVVYRIVLPQVIPRLIEAVRLSLGAAWTALIISEAIASTNGLGYRIFLLQRYLSMDGIIPYVCWITFIGGSVDWLLKQWLVRRYPWYLQNDQ